MPFILDFGDDMKKKLLVCCEESQTVCKAFRDIGWEAYSCDILDCSGEHPEWHVKQDVLPLIDGNCEFTTCDEVQHRIKGEWDMLICHPPCTNLAVSGARWFKEKQASGEQQKSIEFFLAFTKAKCKHIAIENPVGIMSTHYRKPDQIVQPYWFGDPFEKTTCLWLIGLPKLEPTNIVDIPPRQKCKSGKTLPEWYSNAPKKDRARIRSKTFPGFAKAMAYQWDVYLNQG